MIHFFLTLVIFFSYLVQIQFLALQGEIHHVVNPDPYHGIFGSDASIYAKDVQDHIDYGTSGKVAGFIAETIQVSIKNFTLYS